ncbi:MAG: urease accessory protein [Thaumarchaeota archaeon]|nr:urease accessory protein [Nitrososphaerota archaeon]MBI3642038.1 urease accessory protein [Nitrososphaerota archaeon]
MSTNHEFFLMQLADSFFPSGMFGLSNGLESLVKHDRIKNEQDVLNFIEQQIEFQLVPCDCIVFLIAMDAARNENIEELVETDNRFYSMRLIREVRNTSVRSGSQILNCVIQMTSDKNKSKIAKDFQKKIKSNETVGTYPVCLGITANLLGIPTESGIRMMLYSFSQSVIAAAIRLGIIEHISGQKILTILSDKINNISTNIKKESLNNLWQLTPLTDIFQMIHEHNNSKMFIT